MNFKITLSEEDQARCKELANARYKSNRKSGVTNKRIGRQTDEFVELQGIGGEFAFCRLFGIDPDETIHPRSSENDKGDVRLSDGSVVDIKTTHYKTGKLLVVPWKAKDNIDYYGLMIGTFPSFEFKGLMTAGELLVDERLSNMGYGPTYVATQDELNVEMLKGELINENMS